MPVDSVPLAEFESRFDNDRPASITNGELRRVRVLSLERAGKLSRLQGWVSLYLEGKASVEELAAGLMASEATP